MKYIDIEIVKDASTRGTAAGIVRQMENGRDRRRRRRGPGDISPRKIPLGIRAEKRHRRNGPCDARNALLARRIEII